MPKHRSSPPDCLTFIAALALTLTIGVHRTAAAASAAFSLVPAINPLTLQQNAGGTDTINVTTSASLSNPVSLSVSGAPAGVGVAFVGNLLIVYPPLATPVGSYPLTITGTSGTTTVTSSLTLVIKAGAIFTLAPASTSLGVTAGASANDAISINPIAGFAGTVSFSATGLPAGAKATFSPASATSSSSSTITVTTTAQTAAGSYPLTITGSVAGSGSSSAFNETTTVTLIVSAPVLKTQGITFAPIANHVAGTSMSLGASSSSGLAVSYSSSTPSVCTVSSSTAALLASGTCTLTASQSGNAAYAAAASVTQSFMVSSALTARDTTPVNLAGTYNAYGLFASGSAVTNGGFDTKGDAFAANLVGASVVWNGFVFPLGPANVPDTVSGSTVALPSGNYSSLKFLASSDSGAQTGTIVVTYTDGTTTSLTQGFSNWSQGTPAVTQAGESVAVSTAYYLSGAAGSATSPGSSTSFDIFGYSVALNPDKLVASVTLPGNAYIKVFSMILITSPAHATICQAQSGASYCTDQAPGAADAAGYHDLVWANLNKSLVSLAVSDDQVWGIDAAQMLWYLPNFKQGTTWTKVASGVTQISAGHDLLCQINANSHVLCASSPNPLQSTPDANGFQNVTWLDTGATGFKQIAVSAGRQIWGVDGSANLIRVTDYTNLAASSTYVAAGVAQVAVDGRGTVCQVNGNGNVYCSNWAVPATLANPAPYHGLPWVNTGAALTHITVADGIVWGLDASGNIWQWADYTNSNSWYRIAYGGGASVSLSAASQASLFQAGNFSTGDVALMMFMGQSNAVGHDVIPARFIPPASPNVWGIDNPGWNFLPGNTNGATPAYTGSSAAIGSVRWSNFALSPTGPDMNLGFNSNAGPGGNGANFAAYEWQGLINAGWQLPDLYIIDIAWPSQGVDPADATTAVAAWTTHGVNLWQPGLTASQAPSYALAPFARTIMYRALENLISAGKTPRIIGLQWNQWEAEAGNTNPIAIAHAPTNYANLFGSFDTAIGSSFPIQFTKPLSTYYDATTLAQMQTVFANYAAQNPDNRSILDVSQVSGAIFSGGVYGGGDGSVHYNLDTQEWFGTQAVAACISQGNCGTPISSLPTTAPN